MSSEPVRSYLLGTLEESSAAAVEERYFTDRRFFLFVQEMETVLIQDYLAGRLTTAEKIRFEARYLSVPDLRRRLEEVRALNLPAQVAGWQVRPARLLIAAIIVVCVASVAFWGYNHRPRGDALSVSVPARPILATLSLSPGLLKGDASAARLASPTGEGDVLLVLELPGRPVQTLCSSQVSLALPSGSWKSVWSTPNPIWSTSSPGGQELTVRVDASRLVRGDYLVEVSSADGKVQETYNFRVSPL
jgi:hypothetical protein